MKTAYYNTPEKITALVAAAERWRGTPFRENSAVRGSRGGVSCHNLVAAIYVETGAVPPFAVPRGSARRLLNNPADTICTYIDSALGDRFLTIKSRDPADARIGDMLVLKEGRTGKHVAIVLPGEKPEHGLRIVHVLLHSGAAFNLLDDPTYGGALLEIRRPVTAQS